MRAFSEQKLPVKAISPHRQIFFVVLPAQMPTKYTPTFQQIVESWRDKTYLFSALSYTMKSTRYNFVGLSKLVAILSWSGSYVVAQIPMDGSSGGPQVSENKFIICTSPPGMNFVS